MHGQFHIQRATIYVGDARRENPPEAALEEPVIKHAKGTAGQQMKMSKRCYGKTLDTLSRLPPEAGGILLGPKDEPAVITHFVRDEEGVATPVSFTLSEKTLNEVIRRFVGCDMDCKGIAHSHPAGLVTPSQGDLAYVKKVFARDMSLDEFFMPIISERTFYPYVVKGDGRGCKVYRAELVLF